MGSVVRVTRGLHFHTNSIETTVTNAVNMAKAITSSLVRRVPVTGDAYRQNV